MPNPKVGTVVGADQVGDTVAELKKGKIDFRVEKSGIVHAQIGRASMEADQLAENFNTLFATLMRLKPSSAKGTYVKSITISSTMGPGVGVDALEAIRTVEGK
jgi:large subunit ribosomal protein L1